MGRSVPGANLTRRHGPGPVRHGRACRHGYQDKASRGARHSPQSSWPGLSGPPVAAPAATGGPDKPGHHDDRMTPRANFFPASAYPDSHGAWPGHPRLAVSETAKSGMAGPSPAVTLVRRPCPTRPLLAAARKSRATTTALTRISHCDGAGALLDSPARDLIQWWIPDVPRATRGVSFVLEGALAHGRSEEKNLPLPPGNAPQPSCAAARGAQRMSELRRTEASASHLQPLRPLRRTRSGRGRQGTERRSQGLRHGSSGERVCQ